MDEEREREEEEGLLIKKSEISANQDSVATSLIFFTFTKCGRQFILNGRWTYMPSMELKMIAFDGITKDKKDIIAYTCRPCKNLPTLWTSSSIICENPSQL